MNTASDIYQQVQQDYNLTALAQGTIGDVWAGDDEEEDGNSHSKLPDYLSL